MSVYTLEEFSKKHSVEVPEFVKEREGIFYWPAFSETESEFAELLSQARSKGSRKFGSVWYINIPEDQLLLKINELLAIEIDKTEVPKGPVDTCLYRHFDEAGTLLYVGISINAAERTYSHQVGSAWFRQVRRIEIEWYGSKEDAEAAEVTAIKSEKPIYNVVHNK